VLAKTTSTTGVWHWAVLEPGFSALTERRKTKYSPMYEKKKLLKTFVIKLTNRILEVFKLTLDYN